MIGKRCRSSAGLKDPGDAALSWKSFLSSSFNHTVNFRIRFDMPATGSDALTPQQASEALVASAIA